MSGSNGCGLVWGYAGYLAVLPRTAIVSVNARVHAPPCEGTRRALAESGSAMGGGLWPPSHRMLYEDRPERGHVQKAHWLPMSYSDARRHCRECHRFVSRRLPVPAALI